MAHRRPGSDAIVTTCVRKRLGRNVKLDVRRTRVGSAVSWLITNLILASRGEHALPVMRKNMDMVLVSLQLTKINIHLHCISIDEKRGKGGQPASVIAHHDNSTVSRASGLYSPIVRGFCGIIT